MSRKQKRGIESFAYLCQCSNQSQKNNICCKISIFFPHSYCNFLFGIKAVLSFEIRRHGNLAQVFRWIAHIFLVEKVLLGAGDSEILLIPEHFFMPFEFLPHVPLLGLIRFFEKTSRFTVTGDDGL